MGSGKQLSSGRELKLNKTNPSAVFLTMTTILGVDCIVDTSDETSDAEAFGSSGDSSEGELLFGDQELSSDDSSDSDSDDSSEQESDVEEEVVTVVLPERPPHSGGDDRDR